MICLFWPRSGKQHFLWGGGEFLLALSLTKKLALLLFPCLLIWLNSKCFTYLLYDDDDIMSFCVCCIILHLRYVLLIVSSRTIQSLASMPSSQTRQNWSQTKKMMWNYQENNHSFHEFNISIDASWPIKTQNAFSWKVNMIRERCWVEIIICRHIAANGPSIDHSAPASNKFTS